jgi:hypothetical protein
MRIFLLPATEANVSGISSFPLLVRTASPHQHSTEGELGEGAASVSF